MSTQEGNNYSEKESSENVKTAIKNPGSSLSFRDLTQAQCKVETSVAWSGFCGWTKQDLLAHPSLSGCLHWFRQSGELWNGNTTFLVTQQGRTLIRGLGTVTLGRGDVTLLEWNNRFSGSLPGFFISPAPLWTGGIIESFPPVEL